MQEKSPLIIDGAHLAIDLLLHQCFQDMIKLVYTEFSNDAFFNIPNNVLWSAISKTYFGLKNIPKVNRQWPAILKPTIYTSNGAFIEQHFEDCFSVLY